MRNISHIVLHCTATPMHTTVDSILRYWKNTLGWTKPGYHYIIEHTGQVHNLLPIEQVSNGVKGHNANSIHISYIGGVDATGHALDTRTPEQILQQIRLLIELKYKFQQAYILGHRDFPNVAKACPSFDVRAWLAAARLNRLLDTK